MKKLLLQAGVDLDTEGDSGQNNESNGKTNVISKSMERIQENVVMVSCYIVIKSNILSAVLMILCYYCFVQLETAVKKTFPRKAYKRMKRRNHVGFIYKKFSKNRSLKNQHSSKAESSSLNVETEKQLALQYEFPIYQKILFKLNCFFSSEFFCCNFLSYIHCLIVHCLISFVCLVNSI